MEVLLRKASSLARACSQAAAKIDLESTFKISIHTTEVTTNINRVLSTASSDLSRRIYDVLDLNEAQRVIREAIGTANADTVDRLLAEREYLNACEKTLEKVLKTSDDIYTHRGRFVDSTTSVEVPHDFTKLTTTLDSLLRRIAANPAGLIPSQVELSALSPTAVETFNERLAAIRRRRLDLMDELAAANLNKKIKLPEKVVMILRTHKIIDPA